MIEPPKSLVRICDLKPGDEFILWGIRRKVIAVNGSLYFNRVNDRRLEYRNKIGAKSQQIVELFSREISPDCE